MSFCPYCGKQMVNGVCDCPQFMAYTNMQFQNGGGGQSGGGVQPNGGRQPSGGGQPDGYYDNYQYGNGYQDGYNDNGYNGGGYNQDYGNGYSNNMMKEKRDGDPFIIPSFSLNFNSFSSFLSSVRDMIGLGDRAKISGNPYERDVPIIPDCVEAEENELVVKQYNISKMRNRMRFLKAEGRLMITNKRLILRAAGTSFAGHTTMMQQFNLDELAGVNFDINYKFSIINLIECILLQLIMYAICTFTLFSFNNKAAVITTGIIITLVGLIPSFVVYKRFWLKVACSTLSLANCIVCIFTTHTAVILFIILGIITLIITIINLLAVCYLGNLMILVITKGGHGVLGFSGGLRRASLRAEVSSLGYTDVMPWEDTQLAMNELGTILEDLQRNGDYAIQKWTV